MSLLFAQELLLRWKQKGSVDLWQSLPTLQYQMEAVLTLIPSFTVSGENTVYEQKRPFA